MKTANASGAWSAAFVNPNVADSVMRLQKKENTAVQLLKNELAEVEKSIDNLITAMQMGMLTKSTKTS